MPFARPADNIFYLRLLPTKANKAFVRNAVHNVFHVYISVNCYTDVSTPKRTWISITKNIGYTSCRKCSFAKINNRLFQFRNNFPLAKRIYLSLIEENTNYLLFRMKNLQKHPSVYLHVQARSRNVYTTYTARVFVVTNWVVPTAKNMFQITVL